MAGKIFINYRRGDDPQAAGRLFDRLQDVFESSQLFLDVDNIAPGLDFVRVLDERVADCDVVLAVIGKNWIDARDEKGVRRLDDPDDFVRIEITAALTQNKRVIPVLVGDAQMPRAADLPEALRPLVSRNALRLTHERFRADAQGLIKSLQQALVEIEEARTTGLEVSRRAQAEEARQREEATAARLAMEEALRKKTEIEAVGTVLALDAFLTAHPASFFADEAGTLKAALLTREEAYRVALQSNDRVTLRSFVATYGKGADAAHARRLLRHLEAGQNSFRLKLGVAVPVAFAALVLAGGAFYWFATETAAPNRQTSTTTSLPPSVPAIVPAPAPSGRSAAVGSEPKSPAPPGPTPDEAAWSLLKDTIDDAALKRFIQRYPDSALRHEAEARIDALVAERAAKANEAAEAEAGEKIAQPAQAATAVKPTEFAPPPAPLSSEQRIASLPPAESAPAAPAPVAAPSLVQQIKKELQRVGCYAGKVDDDWTSSEVKQSIAKFVKAISLAKTLDQPDTDLLNAIRGQPARVCPLECTKTETISNGTCIAKTCPVGKKLDKDGDCETTVKPHVAARPLPSGTATAPVSAIKADHPGAAAYDPSRGFRSTPPPAGATNCRQVMTGAGLAGWRCS